VPTGWRTQSWGSPKYEFEVVADNPHRVLHLVSNGDSSTINKESRSTARLPGFSSGDEGGRAAQGGDARKKATDDEALQIYVTFPRFPAAVRSRVIGYIWDSTAPAGAIFKSEKTGLVTYVVMRSGDADLGKWITETRNVCEDYKKIYGEEPDERIEAIFHRHRF